MIRIYEKNILPRLVNWCCSSNPVSKQREKIVPKASGIVLEIGAGTGLNAKYYQHDKVEKIWALEPSVDMQKMAIKAFNDTDLDVNFLTANCEDLEVEDNSIDTIVSTYVLCTIPDVDVALNKLRRVLKPGGSLIFTEHGMAPDKLVHLTQNIINPIWKRISGGCNLQRNIPYLIANAGFKLCEGDQMYIPGFKFASYNYWGVARKR